MGASLGIRQRLLLSHLFAAVVVACAFGAFVYYIAAQQVVERMRAQLGASALALARSLDAASLNAALTDTAARSALSERLKAAAQHNSDIARAYVSTRSTADGNRLLASSDGSTDGGAPSDEDGRLIAHSDVPDAPGFVVGLETRSSQIGDALYILRLSAALGALVCVLVALVLSRHLAGRFQVSINDLVQRCRALANGEPLPPRHHAAKRDEFDDLAREFDSMAGRLRHTLEDRERAYAALREANEKLESRVRERTAELEGANSKLKGEIESRVHVEALLAEAALTDALTGLLNRRAMMEMLVQAAAQVKPGEPGLSVIIGDVDRFKRINDLYGHETGDKVLAAVATKLLEFFGEHQQNAARWGGEEFLVLLTGTRLATACKRAEQVRSAVGELRIGSEDLRVTLSLGVAELVAGESIDHCLRRCDQALYRAKEAGRNTVVAAQGTLFATMS